MNNIEQTSAVKFFAVLSKRRFHLWHHCQSALVFHISTTVFFGRMMANFDISVYIIASESLFHPCKIKF